MSLKKSKKHHPSREHPCVICGHAMFTWGNLSIAKEGDTRNKVFFREFGMSYADDDMPIAVRRCTTCGRAVMFINEAE